MRLLLLDTSAAACTAAICDKKETVARIGSDVPRSQASQLVPIIDRLLSENKIKISDIDAVAVSGGPGSYTGLRVGVSTAKGICFGTDKPLLSVSTTELLAFQAIETCTPAAGTIIIPMIDARRMEVYSQPFNWKGEPLGEVSAVILDENSFHEVTDDAGSVIFIGDGVGKFDDFLKSRTSGLYEKSRFIQCTPDASAMRIPAVRKFLNEDFEDVAYYEPFYLKEFVAGISKKSVLF